MRRLVPLAAATVLACLLAWAIAHAWLVERMLGELEPAQVEAGELLSRWTSGEAPPWLRDGRFASALPTMRQFYGGREWRLAWTEHGSPTPQALELAGRLASAADHGLRPQEYEGGAWSARFEAASLGDVTTRALLDARFSAAVATYVRELRYGRLAPAGRGAHGPPPSPDAISSVLERLAESRDVQAELHRLAEPSNETYRRLVEELRRLRENGAPAERIARIELALERQRWYPRDLDLPAIVVNVPEFRLLAIGASGDVELEMDVVVGDAGVTETPLLRDELTRVVFQPYWNVPESIVQNELVPAEKSQHGYLAARGYEILDESGEVLGGAADRATLRALREGRYRLRQRPGPGNALGRVKFLLPNPYNVYLHDTPQKEAFSRERRDLSHGCVRVADPVALARWVLRATPGWDEERIAQALADDETRTVDLQEPISVLFSYHTTVVRNDQVVLLEDVYGRDAPLLEELAELDGDLAHQRRTRPVST